MNELIQARGITRAFKSGDRVIQVLKGLDLDVNHGEMIAIVGESGVGKSTLLHILGAIDRPDAGSYLFEGRGVFAGTSDELARFRNQRIGFVFQFHNLLPEFSALENVMLAGMIGRRPRAEAQAAAAETLRELGVADRYDHLPAELSGGEQQRVAIARALMTAGSLLLADEPTGNLDPETAGRVFALFRQVQKARGLSVVMATHNENLARACDRILVLRDGTLLQADAWAGARP